MLDKSWAEVEDIRFTHAWDSASKFLSLLDEISKEALIKVSFNSLPKPKENDLLIEYWFKINMPFSKIAVYGFTVEGKAARYFESLNNSLIFFSIENAADNCMDTVFTGL
jgi:hypothetical protein